jgi:hypothetical protein
MHHISFEYQTQYIVVIQNSDSGRSRYIAMTDAKPEVDSDVRRSVDGDRLDWIEKLLLPKVVRKSRDEAFTARTF